MTTEDAHGKAPVPQQEILSSVQLGERAHSTIEDLTTRLQNEPAFASAVVRTFFGESAHYRTPFGDNGCSVRFNKDGRSYFVNYKSWPHESSVNQTLHIVEEGSQYRWRWLTSVELSTRFARPAEEGGDIRFFDGNVIVKEGDKKQEDTSSAFDSIPATLSGLFPPPAK